MHKTLGAFAAATVLLLASCGDDDSGGGGQSPLTEAGSGLGQGSGSEGAGAEGSGGAGGSGGGGGGEPQQSFCEWHIADSTEDWESLASGSVDIPPELIEHLDPLVRGEVSSYHQSEVDSWADENCLPQLTAANADGEPPQPFCDWYTAQNPDNPEWAAILSGSVEVPERIMRNLYGLVRGDGTTEGTDVLGVENWVDRNC